jgi:hypothetical protein
MSYDVWISIDTGNGRSVSIGDFNHTFNCALMFYRAMSDAAGLSDDSLGIKHLNEMSCKDAYPLLKKAVQHMVENPDWHKQHNPPNKWGSYESALKFLATLCQQTMFHPVGSIHVWY